MISVAKEKNNPIIYISQLSTLFLSLTPFLEYPEFTENSYVKIHDIV